MHAEAVVLGAQGALGDGAVGRPWFGAARSPRHRSS
jgi:hypothetical protein